MREGGGLQSLVIILCGFVHKCLLSRYTVISSIVHTKFIFHTDFGVISKCTFDRMPSNLSLKTTDEAGTDSVCYLLLISHITVLTSGDIQDFTQIKSTFQNIRIIFVNITLIKCKMSDWLFLLRANM